MTNFIFGTGLARSGGGLYSMALSAHPDIEVACCPNLEFFRSFRNTAFLNSGDSTLSTAFNPNAAIEDWYGSDARTSGLEFLLNRASLDIEFPQDEWPEFVRRSTERGALECADLARRYGELSGATYKEVLQSLLALIQDERCTHEVSWVGFHEAWIIDYFPVIARAFPDARFLVMLRDPRATINSMLAIQRTHPSEVAQVLSYVRHWRKYVALTKLFLQDSFLSDRVHVTTHEHVLLFPEQTMSNIAQSLNLPYSNIMIDTSSYWDHASGAVWRGNGSFESNTSGINVDRAKRWRTTLERDVLNLIEFLCGGELQEVGYQTLTEYASLSSSPSTEVIDSLMRDHRADVNWRSDLEDVASDVGLEVLRRWYVTTSDQDTPSAEIRRAFLLERQYANLRQPNARPLFPELANLW